MQPVAAEAYDGVFVPDFGMFGVAMILIIMLLFIIATSRLFRAIPEMLRMIPWGLILAMGWIGFGGAMGIAGVLARRK